MAQRRRQKHILFPQIHHLAQTTELDKSSKIIGGPNPGRPIANGVGASQLLLGLIK